MSNTTMATNKIKPKTSKPTRCDANPNINTNKITPAMAKTRRLLT